MMSSERILPDDPLGFCRYERRTIHVHFAADVRGDNIRVVTAYHPDHKEWQEDMRTRRETP